MYVKILGKGDFRMAAISPKTNSCSVKTISLSNAICTYLKNRSVRTDDRKSNDKLNESLCFPKIL